MAPRDPLIIEEYPTAHGKQSSRNIEGLRRHYEVERALADRLRSSAPAERRALYGSIYNELFARVPDHPQLTRKTSPELSRLKFMAEYRLVEKYLTADTTFLEIGAGDCALSLHVAGHAHHVTAIDVSDTIFQGISAPPNVRLAIFDGCEIPVEPGSIDLAYSNQVIEHLHPEDAALQGASLLRALKPGGIYVCVTPNRLNGPHDISQYFDTVATGLHLREYTYHELDGFFRRLGFDQTRACIGFKGRFTAVPVWLMSVLEGAMSLLPARARVRIGRTPLFEKLLIINFVARKPVSGS